MFTKAKPFQRLQEMIHLSKTAENLDDLPDRLEKVIESFNSNQIHPQFRTDLYEVLNSATSMAEALANSSYDARAAVKIAVQTISVIGRVIVHLECERPAFQGWGILFTTDRRMYPSSFNTEEEAYKVLDHLGGNAAEVIPIRITSDFAVRPTLATIPVREAFETDTGPAGETTEAEDPLPAAVLPQSTKAFGGPVGEDFVKRFHEAQKQQKYQVVPEK